MFIVIVVSLRETVSSRGPLQLKLIIFSRAIWENVMWANRHQFQIQSCMARDALELTPSSWLWPRSTLAAQRSTFCTTFPTPTFESGRQSAFEGARVKMALALHCLAPSTILAKACTCRHGLHTSNGTLGRLAMRSNNTYHVEVCHLKRLLGSWTTLHCQCSRLEPSLRSK